MAGIKEKGRKPSDSQLGDAHDLQDLTLLGYTAELQRNRSMFTLLFQSLAIAAVGALYHNSLRRLKFPADTVWFWQSVN